MKSSPQTLRPDIHEFCLRTCGPRLVTNVSCTGMTFAKGKCFFENFRSNIGAQLENLVRSQSGQNLSSEPSIPHHLCPDTACTPTCLRDFALHCSSLSAVTLTVLVGISEPGGSRTFFKFQGEGPSSSISRSCYEKEN